MAKLNTLEDNVFPELGLYNIKLVENYVVTTHEEISRALKKISLPCYMKGVSTSDLHKSDKGLVREIMDESEAVVFFKELRQKNDQNMHITLQKREPGIELFIGIKKDPLFDYIALFGLGGIFVEAYKDISYGILPLTKEALLEMIKNTKIGKSLLKGYRGYGIDIEYLHTMLKNSHKLLKDKEFQEIEFNPIIVNKSGKTTAVDVKIIKGDRQQ